MGALLRLYDGYQLKISMAGHTTYRLRKHADYQLVYKGGRKQYTKNIGFFFAPRPEERRSDTPGPRVGLTVPKALGKAHDRNRIKRRLRSLVVRHLALLGPEALDVILHPRRVVLTMEFAALEREVVQVFERVRKAARAAAAKPPAEAAQ